MCPGVHQLHQPFSLDHADSLGWHSVCHRGPQDGEQPGLASHYGLLKPGMPTGLDKGHMRSCMEWRIGPNVQGPYLLSPGQHTLKHFRLPLAAPEVDGYRPCGHIPKGGIMHPSAWAVGPGTPSSSVAVSKLNPRSLMGRGTA